MVCGRLYSLTMACISGSLYFMGFCKYNYCIIFTEVLDRAEIELVTSELQIPVLEIDYVMISMAIFLLMLIQEGLVSLTSESMYTKYWLTA